MSKTKETGGVPQELQSDMSSLEETLSNLENYLAPYFKSPMKDIVSHLTDLEAAKLNIVIAYSINTLFYSMCMKSEGKERREMQGEIRG